jgi:hypothetical protein
MKTVNPSTRTAKSNRSSSERHAEKAHPHKCRPGIDSVVNFNTALLGLLQLLGGPYAAL